MKPREERIGIIGIYKITSPSGKIYIGQSWNIKNRFYQYFRCQCEGQKFLWRSLKKYGVENHKFEIIHYIPNHTWQNELDYFEHFYWEFFKKEGVELLNLIEPALYGKASPDTIAIFKRLKSEEHKKKIGLAHKGTKHSSEHCRKNGLAKRGQYPKSAKKVVNLITQEVYPSARVAAEVFNMSHSTLKSSLNGSRPNKTNLIYYENWNNNSSNK